MNIELNRIQEKKVLVIGDVMLDTYHIGEVKRISPEAPVPIVRVSRTYNVPGGAANVARNLLGLGCCPCIVGLLGNDHNGETLQQMFRELHIETCLFRTPLPTITKTRVLGNNQQVVRLDFETEHGCMDARTERELTDAVRDIIPRVDIVIISDYGKGVCSPAVCQSVIADAARLGKQVIVDPKGTDWEKYRSSTVITPNLKELSAVSGTEVRNEDAQIHEVAHRVLDTFDLASLLVTRSEKGMSYIDSESFFDIPTEAREVYDVSGAGDTVVATLAAALAAGIPMQDAIYLANKAAGVVVGKMGTSPILFEELQQEIHSGKMEHKVVRREDLSALVQSLRTQNRRIVFTNGCFDILHKGHVVYLEKARRLGDVLIVGLNSDSSVKRLKGETRPINDENARATLLAALEMVDYVVVFEEDTPLNLIRTVAPDVLVKGGDYAIENIVGREYAAETVTISFVEGYSTTRTLSRLSGGEAKGQ